MSDEVLLVEQRDHIATLTINRPEKLNALNSEIIAGLVEHIDRLSAEGEVRCVVIRGQGERAFSAGFDLTRAPGQNGPQPDSNKDPSMQWPIRRPVDAIFDAPFLVIAMIQGYCVGGGLGLATECDMRIAADTAELGITPSKLGIIYAYEGIQVFVDLVGPAFTKELFCCGRRVSAERALAMGLVNQVVPAADLESAVYGLAEELADNAPLSVKGHKAIVNTLIQRRVEGSALSEADIHVMKEAQRVAAESEDNREGRLAFREKRKPVFQGR